jgi:hypothetical protein
MAVSAGPGVPTVRVGPAGVPVAHSSQDSQI